MHRFRPKRPSPALVVAVVALAAALTGTAVAEMATTARLDRVEKKQTRKIAKKIAAKISKRQANRQITRRAPGLSVASAADAASLGGSPAGSYQGKADLLSATVAPANAAATVLRGRGATAVTRVAPGFYGVTFNRDVTGCTWTATYGQPNNAGVNALWATVRGRPSPNEVGVVLRDQAGAQQDGNGFHLLVLCP